MEVFDVIKPPNEAELSRLLRARSLSKVVGLTLRRQPDELSARRNKGGKFNNDEIKIKFFPSVVYADPPASVVGTVSEEVVVGGVVLFEGGQAGSINVDGQDPNEENNRLTFSA